jgi:uncharacterized protein (DUF305 family)
MNGGSVFLKRVTFMKPIIIASLLLFASSAMAQNMNHDMHKGHKMGSANESASTKDFRAVNDKMHKGMMIEFSGDADVDFVRGMIPHHQGAIDMAKIELLYGKDAETRKLAEAIIKAQETEIAQMQAWLKARGK